MFRCVTLMLLFVLVATGVEAGDSGIVTGRVIDAATGHSLPGANVVVEGTALGDATDAAGRFRIVGVPKGLQRLEVSYLGYRSEMPEIRVTGGRTVSAGVVALRVSALRLGTMLVEGVRQGQARALNRQKTADNIRHVVAADLIGRFPDPNTAEAVQRIPGVSVQRDQGEGRYVLIRGTEPRLTSVTIDGEQIPSPEGDRARRGGGLQGNPGDRAQPPGFRPELPGGADLRQAAGAGWPVRISCERELLPDEPGVGQQRVRMGKQGDRRQRDDPFEGLPDPGLPVYPGAYRVERDVRLSVRRAVVPVHSGDLQPVWRPGVPAPAAVPVRQRGVPVRDGGERGQVGAEAEEPVRGVGYLQFAGRGATGLSGL